MTPTLCEMLVKAVVAAGFALLIQVAHACDCAPMKDANEHSARIVARADEIVRAVATQAPQGDQFTGFTQRVRVLEAIRSKASVGQELTIGTGALSCAVTLSVGEEWLLFLQSREMQPCGGSVPLDHFDPVRVAAAGTGYRETMRASGLRLLERARSAVGQTDPPPK